MPPTEDKQISPKSPSSTVANTNGEPESLGAARGGGGGVAVNVKIAADNNIYNARMGSGSTNANTTEEEVVDGVVAVVAAMTAKRRHPHSQKNAHHPTSPPTAAQGDGAWGYGWVSGGGVDDDDDYDRDDQEPFIASPHDDSHSQDHDQNHNGHPLDGSGHYNYLTLSFSQREEAGISWYKAVFLIVNAALGAGLLNFPRAFHEAGGILTGNLIHCLFTVLAFGSLFIIARCAEKCSASTYHDLVLQTCNVGWSLVSAVCIAVYCFVTCITFIIIIGDQSDRVFASFVGSDFCHRWYLNRKFTMAVTALLLVFPCCFRRIDRLRHMSYVGVVAIWYLVAIIVAEYYTGDYEQGPINEFDVSWMQVFDVVPTICFGYQCHVSCVPIYSCLRDRRAATFMKSCGIAILMCLTVYTLSANYGYLTFGSYVDGDVLLSYDATKPHVLIAVILLAIKSWTTYPILMFCVREAIADIYIMAVNMPADDIARYEARRRKLIAVVLWAASILMAVFTPNINIVVKLLGSLAAIFIFVFPGIFLVQDATGGVYESFPLDSRAWVLAAIGCGYVAVGMFAFGLAFTLGVEHIIHPDSSQPLCH